MDAERWIPEEPREESQFLQVIGHAVLAHDPWSLIASERISDFQIVLTSGNLTGVSPGGSVVDEVRIVHKFGDLMRRYGAVTSCGREQAADIKVEGRIRLERNRSGGKDGVEPANATVIQVGRIADRHRGVVQH